MRKSYDTFKKYFVDLPSCAYISDKTIILELMKNSLSKKEFVQKCINVGKVEYAMIPESLMNVSFASLERNLERRNAVGCQKKVGCFPFEMLMDCGKGRHLWLWGPPNSGKTSLFFEKL